MNPIKTKNNTDPTTIPAITPTLDFLKLEKNR